MRALVQSDVSCALERYEAAKSALTACKSVDEVKGWADRAAATQAYARMAKDKGLEVDAAEIRIRAERRLGEMLRDQKAAGGMSKGGRKTTGSSKEPVSHVIDSIEEPIKLAEIGVDKKLSARAQKIAAVPEAEFESEVADWREKVEEEGVRVTARLEIAGAKVLDGAPETYDEGADFAADFEAMSKIIDSDDRLGAAMDQIRAAGLKYAVLEGLYVAKSSEVLILTKEASRWMRKAKKASACQDCMTAMERE